MPERRVSKSTLGWGGWGVFSRGEEIATFNTKRQAFAFLARVELSERLVQDALAVGDGAA